MKTDKESFIIRIKKLKEDIRGNEITNTKLRFILYMNYSDLNEDYLQCVNL